MPGACWTDKQASFYYSITDILSLQFFSIYISYYSDLITNIILRCPLRKTRVKTLWVKILWKRSPRSNANATASRNKALITNMFDYNSA